MLLLFTTLFDSIDLKVDGECGEYSLAWGYWDYCLYKDSSKPDYVNQPWNVKHDMIWQEVKADPNFGEYHPANALTESVVTTFENEWDVMPAGRVKVQYIIQGLDDDDETN